MEGPVMAEEADARESMIVLDREVCVGCFECMDVCPQTRSAEYPVFVRGEDGFPQVANAASCIGCLSCETDCRAMAIRIEGAEGGRSTWAWEVRAELKRRAMF